MRSSIFIYIKPTFKDFKNVLIFDDIIGYIFNITQLS